MKKNRVLRLGLLALVLTLVTASLVSGTLAKYVTTVNGTGTVEVAHWNAKVGADGSNYYSTGEFNLAQTINKKDDVITGNYIAPGTEGSFSLAYTTNGWEVDHKITINIKVKSGTLPKNMTFAPVAAPTGWTSAGKISSAEGVADTTGITYTSPPIEAAGATGSTGTISFAWTWPEGTAVVGNLDTIDGETNSTVPIVFEATFTAVQDNNHL